VSLLFSGEADDVLLPFEDRERLGVFDEVSLFITFQLTVQRIYAVVNIICQL
jgi:hypothetical protein